MKYGIYYIYIYSSVSVLHKTSQALNFTSTNSSCIALPLWIDGKGICCNMMSAAVLWCHRPTTARVLSLTLESLTTEQAARPGLDGILG